MFKHRHVAPVVVFGLALLLSACGGNTTPATVPAAATNTAAPAGAAGGAATTSPAVATASAAAATAPAGAAAGAAGNTLITVGYSGGASIEPYFKQVFDQAAKDLPGIRIKPVVYATYDDLLNQLPAQVAANTAPDVLYWTNEQLGEYASQAVLAPLDDLLPQTSINLGDYYKGLVDGWKFNGKLYAVPFNGQDSALVVNQGLLTQAGIAGLPKTIADVRTDAKAVKDKTGQTGLVLEDNLFHVSQYVYAFGGGWNGGKTINSPQNAQALQFLIDMFNTDKSAATQKQLGASWDGEAFAKNKVGLSTGGPWYIGYMAASGPQVKYALMPIPTKDGGTTMVTYGGGLSVMANAKDKAAAMKVIDYMSRDQFAQLMVTSSLQYLPAKTKYLDLYVQNVPAFAPLKDAFAQGRALDYPVKSKEFGDDFINAFEQLLFQPGGQTPQQMLDALQQKYGSQ